MKTRLILYAEEGMILTDGHTYGKTIFLSDEATEKDFREITQSEYEAVEKKKGMNHEIADIPAE